MFKLTDSAFKDELVNRFVSDANSVIYAREQTALRLIKLKKNDLHTLFPFVSWYRSNILFNEPEDVSPIIISGIKYLRDDLSKGKVKIFPVKLEYSVSFWSDNFDDCNNFFRNYFFWRYNTKNLLVTYNDGIIDIDFNVPIEYDTPRDTSEIQLEFEKGRIYNIEVIMRVWSAGLVDITDPIKEVVTIDLDVYNNAGNILLFEENLT